MMRYQLSNGRKLISHASYSSPVRVQPESDNPIQTQPEPVNGAHFSSPSSGPVEPEARQHSNGKDLFLQWGHKKRPRRAENRTAGDESTSPVVKIQRRAAIAGAVKIAAAAASLPTPFLKPCINRTVEERSEKKRPSDKPQKKLSAAARNGFGPDRHNMKEKASKEQIEWPRIYVSLSRKEKEEDFMAMKGTKLPQRPKKRPKNVDKSLQYCFPGMWLSDLPKGRYEVREKKCVKKKARGLKGMESMESDSD